MNASSHRVFRQTQRRLVAGLLLVTAVLSWLSGPVAPARAAPTQPESRDPSARVQVVVKGVHVFDDHDPGDGEMALSMTLTCTAAPSPCFGASSVDLDQYQHTFSAGTGETVPLNLAFPTAPTLSDAAYEASAYIGCPGYAGHSYELRFSIQEQDTFSVNDLLGDARLRLERDHNWGLGTRTVRATKGPGIDGDFEVEIEVRYAHLPDLVPAQITVSRPAGANAERVCVTVANVGEASAAAFSVSVRLDDVPAPVAVVYASPLDVGQQADACVNAALPKTGSHKLVAWVDQERNVYELVDANNRLERPYQAVGPSVPPTLTPSEALPDLTVSAIKVNGQTSDGKSDCTDGKNTVTAIVRNDGIARADSSAVLLAIDSTGDSNRERSIGGIEPGNSREVTLGEVRLKRGEHTLIVTADAKEAVRESDEGNNTSTATVRCSGDN